ncbi:MAG TPA: TauD/TfdA family dioxygenase [Longimicrobium sp.]|nr:TauD/TfdA family dioxygenase [Longimicrobium sp.]
MSLSAGSLVASGHLPEREGKAPLLLRPSAGPVNLLEWAEASRAAVTGALEEWGAVLFRGFALDGVEAFERFMAAVSPDLLEYRYRSTPRTRVKGNVYTSTEYPADQEIPFHNEMSYTRSWPLRIAFYSIRAAAEGGETPLADSRRVHELVDPAVRERFERHGVMYTRNYTPRLDLPWREVFGVETRAEVEAFCDEAGIEYEWVGPEHLRTRQVCQATAAHPRTGERLWFNQAHLFHVTSLPREAREALLAGVDEADLPRNTYYGDGSPIEPEALENVRRAFRGAEIRFGWEDGDVLLADNMRMAHGRAPFRGERRVVVAMSGAWGADRADAAAGAA